MGSDILLAARLLLLKRLAVSGKSDRVETTEGREHRIRGKDESIVLY